MALKQGAVQAVKETRTFDTKYGEKKHVNVKLDDGEFYTVQFEDANKPLRFKEGQTLEFKYSQETSNKTDNNGEPYVNNVVDKKTLEITDGGPTDSGTPAGTAATPSSSTKAPAVDDKQDQIMRQNALSHAAQIVGNTLTSKSSQDQAAQDVVDMADRFFFHYAKYGKQAVEQELEREMIQRSDQEQVGGPDDGSDIPF